MISLPADRRCLANQRQVAHLLEITIVGDAGGAIAKAELGANEELDLAAAIVGPAAERLSFPPGICAKGQWLTPKSRLVCRLGRTPRALCEPRKAMSADGP